MTDHRIEARRVSTRWTARSDSGAGADAAETNRPAAGDFTGRVGDAIGPIEISDALPLDLTATEKFGTLEAGVIAYGTTRTDGEVGLA